MKWHLFLALVHRVAVYESRDLLRELDAVTGGIGTAFDQSGFAGGRRQMLVDRAFPWPPLELPNG